MLIPLTGIKILEYDAVLTVSPTSRFGHNSDSVLATVEMLVENDQQEAITFPFAVLNTDSGINAEDHRSVKPKVINGSRMVRMSQKEDEVDENQLAEQFVQRAQAAGMTDAADLEKIREWGREVIARAERTMVGRTRIKPGERRRIVLQQRIRVQPGDDGRYALETIAPLPVAVLVPGGRVSLTVLMPWEDEDIRVEILERTEGFEVEQGRIKQRQWVAWFWRYDPLFRLVYRYA